MISVNKTPALDILGIKPCGEDRAIMTRPLLQNQSLPNCLLGYKKATAVEALSGNLSNFQS